MEQLLLNDYKLFYLINNLFTNNVFDFIMPLIRNKYFWVPFYVFLFSFFIINCKNQSLVIISFLLITVIIADQMSSHILKPWVERLRPCNDPDIQDSVRLLVNCKGSFSFPSSHATNHFAIAFYLITLLGRKFKPMIPVLILWAFTIGYAQIYVGLHYPLDIIAGACLGILIGVIIGRLPKKYFDVCPSKSNQSS